MHNPDLPGLELDIGELREELSALRELFCQSALASGRPPADPAKSLAVFRICQGLDLDEWSAISDRLSLKSWLAAPLDGEELPLLRHVQNVLEELAYQTDHDPLTGLANRRAFERGLDMELERARRSSTPICLAVIDLDDFKKVNDTFGHLCGDTVLVTVARAIERAKRRYDLASRLGGEEFAVILSGVGTSEAEVIATRLLDSVREARARCEDGSEVGITCSIGLVPYKGRADLSAARLFEVADKALYEAKRAGKNRLVLAQAPDLAAAPRRTLVQASEKQFLFTGSREKAPE